MTVHIKMSCMIDGINQLARIFKALGDPNRLDIVVSIGNGVQSVTEIITATGLSQTLVSFHLRILREACVVTAKRDGPFVYYSLSDPMINGILLRFEKFINSGMNIAVNLSEPETAKKQAGQRRK